MDLVKMYLLLKMGISIAMLVHQRVKGIGISEVDFSARRFQLTFLCLSFFQMTGIFTNQGAGDAYIKNMKNAHAVYIKH